MRAFIQSRDFFCCTGAQSLTRPMPRRCIFRAIADGVYDATKNRPMESFWWTCCRPCIEHAWSVSDLIQDLWSSVKFKLLLLVRVDLAAGACHLPHCASGPVQLGVAWPTSC
ncbi:uncharacterized protein LOC142814272 isoform X2 [Rhipicephalus microplus]|uniref:uncharacterized protein LOC142814272 isoform X2 n=1 Tax=Rhipicephalus microplus TaxID=6941 RepID=UPI003F6AE865